MSYLNQSPGQVLTNFASWVKSSSLLLSKIPLGHMGSSSSKQLSSSFMSHIVSKARALSNHSGIKVSSVASGNVVVYTRSSSISCDIVIMLRQNVVERDGRLPAEQPFSDSYRLSSSSQTRFFEFSRFFYFTMSIQFIIFFINLQESSSDVMISLSTRVFSLLPISATINPTGESLLEFINKSNSQYSH